jgi:hypothetical protein
VIDKSVEFYKNSLIKVKKFSEMTSAEIQAMSDEEFKAVSPFEKRSCYHCGHLKSALSWWCTCKEAKEARGTSLPGIIKCTYWIPDWKVIPKEYKTPENGYVPPAEIIKEKTKNIFTKIYEICKIS